MSATSTGELAIADGIAPDRSDWELVCFGDIALKQNETVNREDTDLTCYVNGGHMGSEDLHLREWGDLTDEYLGPAFTRKFSKGDILYGSRRTYLRKVAVAHFDGITANTTFVVKPNEERIIKELLPFVMLSEGFAQHSIRNSKGSVNPYINWKDIANYEFLLPPKDQQAKLAELLWAADRNVECILRMQRQTFRAKSMLMVKLKRMYFDKSIKGECEDFTKGRVDDFFVLQRGFDLTKKNAIPGEIPVISSSGFSYFHNEAKCEAPGVVTGRKGKLGDVYYLNEPHWPHDTSLWVKDFKNSYPKFVYWFLKSIGLDSFNAATAVPTLNRNVIHPLKVIFPCSKCQKSISQKLDAVDEHLASIESHKETAGRLFKSLINQIF